MDQTSFFSEESNTHEEIPFPTEESPIVNRDDLNDLLEEMSISVYEDLFGEETEVSMKDNYPPAYIHTPFQMEEYTFPERSDEPFLEDTEFVGEESNSIPPSPDWVIEDTFPENSDVPFFEDLCDKPVQEFDVDPHIQYHNMSEILQFGQTLEMHPDDLMPFLELRSVDPNVVMGEMTTAHYANLIKTKRFEAARDLFQEYGEIFNLPENALPFEELLQYHLNGNLDEGDLGKCILCYDDSNNVTLACKPAKFGITTRLRGEDLLHFFYSGHFHSTVGMHRNIPKPEDSRIIGGASYLVLDSETVFVGYKSGDFGVTQKTLVERCLNESGFKLETLNDDHFSDRSVVDYLKRD
jgi:hypothetical protein